MHWPNLCQNLSSTMADMVIQKQSLYQESNCRVMSSRLCCMAAKICRTLEAARYLSKTPNNLYIQIKHETSKQINPFWDPRLSQTSLQPILPEKIRQRSQGNMAGILQVYIACCILHTIGAVSDGNLGILTIWVPLNRSNPKSKPDLCVSDPCLSLDLDLLSLVGSGIRIFFFRWIRILF